MDPIEDRVRSLEEWRRQQDEATRELRDAVRELTAVMHSGRGIIKFLAWLGGIATAAAALFSVFGR